MPVTLPALPYDMNALEPVISARTFEFHHDKHHQAYVDNTNKLIDGTDLADKDLETIVRIAAADPAKKGLFNNAAQVWNHGFFWQCMKPGGGGKPTGKIAAQIDADLGGYEKFVADFKNAGVTQFGGGDFDAQAEQVFVNLDRVLRASGSSLANVIKVTIFLCDMRIFQRSSNCAVATCGVGPDSIGKTAMTPNDGPFSRAECEKYVAK